MAGWTKVTGRYRHPAHSEDFPCVRGVRTARPSPARRSADATSPAPVDPPFRAGGDQAVRAATRDLSLRGRMSQTRHVPVMLQRCLDLLAPALQAPGPPAPVVVDCTLG